MSVEELESIRLIDFEHLDQETAANLVKASRQTYGLILANARSILAKALDCHRRNNADNQMRRSSAVH